MKGNYSVGLKMENAKKPGWGFVILAIGIFFIIVTSVLYALDIIKSNRLLIYDSASFLLVVLGVIYVVLSRRLPREQKHEASKKSLKDKQRRHNSNRRPAVFI